MELQLTERQAFRAMTMFLEEFYERTKPGDLPTLLGDMQLLPDGGTADPAAWHDWHRCAERALGESRY